MTIRIILEEDVRSAGGPTCPRRARVTLRRVHTWGRLRARWRALDPRVADAAVALFAAVEFQLELLASPAPAEHRGLASLLLLALAVAVLLRRRHPVAAVAIAMGAFVGLEALDAALADHFYLPLVALLAVGYSLGRRAGRAGLAIGVVLLVAGMTGSIALDEVDDDLVNWANDALLLVVAPVAVGRAIRGRAQLNRALRERAARLEAERAASVERAAEEERVRIASELQDLVGHALGAMVIQAAGAKRLAARDPERARAAFGAVESTGRDAMDEMRRLLGVLGSDEAEPALAPQPSLAHIDALVARAQAAGLPTSLRIEGAPGALSAGVDVTAYRVVQEALRAAVGGAGTAHVTVRWADGAVFLEVLDDGLDGARRLLGMRERVALYGGELQTGLRRRGGHAVRARLPTGGVT